MQQALDLIAELMGPQGPDIAQPRPVAAQSRIFELALEPRLVVTIQLQREEQQDRGDARRRLLAGLIELAVGRVAHVAGIGQLGIAHQPAQPLFQGLVRPHRGAELCPGKRLKLTRMIGLKSLGFGLQGSNLRLHLRTVAAWKEVAQVPLRQLAQLFRRLAHAILPISLLLCLNCPLSSASIPEPSKRRR